MIEEEKRSYLEHHMHYEVEGLGHTYIGLSAEALSACTAHQSVTSSGVEVTGTVFSPGDFVVQPRRGDR
jgi:hypothetical protein